MTTRGKWAFSVIFAAAIAFLLGLYGAGFYRSDNSLIGASGSSKPTAGPHQTYAMNVVVSQVPFWSETRMAWEEIPRHFPVRTVFGGPQNDNSQQQIDEVEALLASRISGLVIAPTDSKALVTTINKAVDQGIPVVTYLVDAPNSKRLTYITSPLEEASKTIGSFALQATQKPTSGGVIISYGTAGSEEQERRADGFRQLIRTNTGMKLIGIVEDKFDESVGADQIKALLVRNKSVKYIFGCNSRSAAGAVLALKELGMKPGDVVVTGWDQDPDVLAYIKEGWVSASAAQRTTFMTNLAFGILHSAANNYMYPRGLNFRASGHLPLPDRIEIPVAVVSSKNVAAFQAATK